MSLPIWIVPQGDVVAQRRIVEEGHVVPRARPPPVDKIYRITYLIYLIMKPIYTNTQYIAFFKSYRKAKTKKEKSVILSSTQEKLGVSRKYLLRVISLLGRTPKEDKRHIRGVVYGNDVREALVYVWREAECMCASHLHDYMGDHIGQLKAFAHFSYPRSIEDQLLKMSASTIGRMIRPFLKAKVKKAQQGTVAAERKFIPIRKNTWSVCEPGSMCIDLVEHNGGTVSGEYFRTLCATDVLTGWTLLVVLKNKSAKEVLRGIHYVIKACPYAIVAVHIDNGTEFLNGILIPYLRKHAIKVTRSRAYRSNDNAHVESKNYSIVRYYTGYWRYETHQSFACLEGLYARLNEYINFFKPTTKKIVKEITTEGKHIIGYSKALTPYERCRMLSILQESFMDKRNAIDPYMLREEIACWKKELFNSVPKRSTT